MDESRNYQESERGRNVGTPLGENAPAPGWKSKPSWFLLAEEDRMINPKTQRFMAGRMGAKVRSSRVDHSPMYSAPDFAIDVILEAASVTLGDGSLPGRAATG
jgi:hypothetical protein